MPLVPDFTKKVWGVILTTTFVRSLYYSIVGILTWKYESISTWQMDALCVVVEQIPALSRKNTICEFTAALAWFRELSCCFLITKHT